MLLQRKSLAFVGPFGKRYLFFMLLKVSMTVISPAKIIKILYDERNCIGPV